MEINIQILDPSSTAAASLIALSDAYMAALYPAESNHLESIAALSSKDVHFIGCHVDGQLAACGAVKKMVDEIEQVAYGEIKRVFVMEEFRGRGLSRQVMQALEAHLLGQGIGIARLETGIRQPEALNLYARLGYTRRDIFGDYAKDPLSVFMEKQLPA